MPKAITCCARSGIAQLPKAARQIVAGLAIGMTLTSGVSASNLVGDVGGSERVNLAGQLGTLSQRIIASACNLDAGIATTESNAVLQISADQFGRISDALLYGNRGFGILGEESRAKTLQAITALNDAWAPLLETAVKTEVSANDASQIQPLADQSGKVLDSAYILASEVNGQYADPVNLLQADAMLIEFAARQRMLAAQMSKNACLIASGINAEAASAELQAGMTLFDNTLTALRNGHETAGVKPPPTAQIEAGLQFVVDEWDAIQPPLATLLAGDEVTSEARQRLFFAFLGMEARMNNVVVMYDKNSKLGL